MKDLLEHFQSTFSSNDDALPTENNDPIINEASFDPELDCDISLDELKQATFHQKNNAAYGLDNVCAEAIKSSFDLISESLLNIVNHIFNSGEYPETWGHGIISPVFKGGDPDLAKNYRGITISNILSKIYSQILLNRLNKWTDKYDILCKNQFGFQKGKSTTDCIFILHSIISKVLNSKEKLYCVFIDFEKAFDKIDRITLWQKLIQANVSSKIVKSLKAMYSVVKACIKYKGRRSDFIDSHFGVKQGDPSSPLLFMMFINDINQCINDDLDGIFAVNGIKFFLLLYADVQVIFAKSPQTLQTMLSELETYCNAWGLKINTAKTKTMIFEKGRHTSYDFNLNNTKLEVVTTFKYLGVYFFKNGNWHRTQKSIADHASFALHNLFSLFTQVEIPISQKCKLFDALVGSILNYSSEIWGGHEAKDVELIHNKFCRKILCVRQSTNLNGIYGELGRVPMSIMRKINMIRYWFKILKSDDSTLPTIIYRMLKTDADNNITYNGVNWASQIKNILQTHGFSNLWINQDVNSVPFTVVKQRILDVYQQSWYADINNSPRLSTYCRFKHAFTLEKYLDSVFEKKYRIALCKFRISAHNLAIEKGRHQNIPRENRKCIYCNLNVIESEYHFLLVCPQLIDIRRKYLSPYYCHWPNLTKFDTIMSSDSKKTILNIAKFIYFADRNRNSNN